MMIKTGLGEHRAALELDEAAWREMKRCADEAGILFTGSGWDEASPVGFLQSTFSD